MRVNAYWFLGNLVLVHVTGEDTDGRFSLVETLVRPGDVQPLHVHRRADQTWYVLEGEMKVYLPGQTVVATRGEVVYGPPGLPHTHEVTSSEPVRFVEVNSPAGFEAFVATVGEPARQLSLPPRATVAPDLKNIAPVAAEYGIELLGPPGTLP